MQHVSSNYYNKQNSQLGAAASAPKKTDTQVHMVLKEIYEKNKIYFDGTSNRLIKDAENRIWENKKDTVLDGGLALKSGIAILNNWLVGTFYFINNLNNCESRYYQSEQYDNKTHVHTYSNGTTVDCKYGLDQETANILGIFGKVGMGITLVTALASTVWAGMHVYHKLNDASDTNDIEIDAMNEIIDQDSELKDNLNRYFTFIAAAKKLGLNDDVVAHIGRNMFDLFHETPREKFGYNGPACIKDMEKIGSEDEFDYVEKIKEAL